MFLFVATALRISLDSFYGISVAMETACRPSMCACRMSALFPSQLADTEIHVVLN